MEEGYNSSYLVLPLSPSIESFPKKCLEILVLFVRQVMGLARKRNYHGRWDVLIDLSTKCLNKMLEMAAHKKRNYILDQV